MPVGTGFASVVVCRAMRNIKVEAALINYFTDAVIAGLCNDTQLDIPPVGQSTSPNAIRVRCFYRHLYANADVWSTAPALVLDMSSSLTAAGTCGTTPLDNLYRDKR